jgi:hypothetical protein
VAVHVLTLSFCYAAVLMLERAYQENFYLNTMFVNDVTCTRKTIVGKALVSNSVFGKDRET